MAATFEYGAVVGQPESDSAAVSILRKGGNAVDAAVTAAFLACVLSPKSCGIGGYGGAMTAYIGGEVVCIDFKHRRAQRRPRQDVSRNALRRAIWFFSQRLCQFNRL